MRSTSSLGNLSKPTACAGGRVAPCSESSSTDLPTAVPARGAPCARPTRYGFERFSLASHFSLALLTCASLALSTLTFSSLAQAQQPAAAAKPDAQAAATPEPEPAAPPRVSLLTTHGEIIVELMPDKAPKTVDNFLNYVKAGHYNGTIFHRVIRGFMIQGGGYNSVPQLKATNPPIVNESSNGVSNTRGTITMARQADANSATAQFFINLVDNTYLNYTGPGTGYAVFGKVVEGMAVVDAIAAIPTVAQSAEFSNFPKDPVVIQKVTVVASVPTPAP